MSSGGISPGLDFWATIKISGTLDQKGIHKVMQEIQDILNGIAPGREGEAVNGRIVTKARFTSNWEDHPQLQVSFGPTEERKR